jgi:hypothetical protein
MVNKRQHKAPLEDLYLHLHSDAGQDKRERVEKKAAELKGSPKVSPQGTLNFTA